MTLEYQNFADFCSNLSYPKIELFREIRKKLDVSMVTLERWSKLDSQTKNKEALDVLSKVTGIAPENLFKRHEASH